MPTDVIMPQMGESIFEGTLTKWLKKPGDKVQRDEPLFEISTDKVDAEIPAPASGTLADIKVAEGTTVQVNTVVGTIAAEGESVAAGKAAPPRQLRRNPRNQLKPNLRLSSLPPKQLRRPMVRPQPSNLQQRKNQTRCRKRRAPLRLGPMAAQVLTW